MKYKEYYGIEDKPKKIKVKKTEERNIVLEDIKKEIKDLQEDFQFTKMSPGYSSKEAKKIIDNSLKNWAKDIRKVEGRIVKDWMSKAKSGVIDYFDIVRGIQVGDVSRAHPYETKFFKAMIDRDKIMNRFRQYFGGKKGKPGYRGPK